MGLSPWVFRLPRELDPPGRPIPSAGSRRSAGWAPGTVARVEWAVRRRGAPLSTGSPAGVEPGCAATRGAALVPTGHRPDSTVDQPRPHPPGAPSARRDSGGTIRVAVRARSTECRTGSTPGSPDQRSPGDEAAPCSASRSLGNMNSCLWLSTVSTGLSTMVLGADAIGTASTRQPGSQLWITTG
jgi:hypothetical protein